MRNRLFPASCSYNPGNNVRATGREYWPMIKVNVQDINEGIA